jgi:hypothetical protein
VSHTDHNWRHVPRDRGGTDPLGPWDSTENVGDSYGIRSDGPETEGWVLTADGSGGSLWAAQTGGSGGGGLGDVILDSAPDAFWKLNETSGVVAADSSGNNWDLGVDTGFTAPVWAQAEGPPGETSAAFDKDDDDQLARTASPAFPAYTGAFTAMCWVRMNDYASINASHYFMGQGSPWNLGGSGWQLHLIQAATGLDNKLRVAWNDGSGGHSEIIGNNILTINGAVWYHFAVTRSAGGLWTLYVNGLAQSSTSSAAFTGIGGMKLGNLNASNQANLDGLMSYAGVWGRALSGDEILEFYQLGEETGTGSADGYVWTTDGAGIRSWQPTYNHLLDAKGDLIAASANDVAERVAVGVNGKRLIADSTAAAGVAWGTELINYTEFTSNVTVAATAEATPTDVVSSGAITYAATPIKIEFFAPVVVQAGTAGGVIVVNLWDASTDLGRVGVWINPSTVQNGNPGYGVRFLTPTAASHTYRFRAWRSSTSGSVEVGAGGAGTRLPGFIRVSHA